MELMLIFDFNLIVKWFFMINKTMSESEGAVHKLSNALPGGSSQNESN